MLYPYCYFIYIRISEVVRYVLSHVWNKICLKFTVCLSCSFSSFFKAVRHQTQHQQQEKYIRYRFPYKFIICRYSFFYSFMCLFVLSTISLHNNNNNNKIKRGKKKKRLLSYKPISVVCMCFVLFRRRLLFNFFFCLFYHV